MICIYIYNFLLAILKVLIILTVLSISRFYDTYTSRSGVGGLDSTIYTMSLYFCYYGLLLLNVHITVIMTIVFMTTSGIITV